MDYQYDYDKMDNITTRATEHGNYGYGYDDLYRLTEADSPDGAGLSDEAFTYDKVGNRLTSADAPGPWAYNGNNALTARGDVTYEYDANGNMTKKVVAGVVTRFVYNPEDRLTQVWTGEAGSGDLIAEYYYDPFGRRLWKQVGAARTYFHYSDQGLIAEYDGAGNEVRAYGYKPDSLWTTDPLFMKTGGRYYFYHNDHLGTPQKMTDVSGAVVWSAKSESFGETVVEMATVENNLRFPGQYYDVETGLHYNWFRYYDPNTGRYLRVDPVGLWGGVNAYAYGLNNPFNMMDPYGLFVETSFWGGGAIILTTVGIMVVVGNPVGLVAAGVGYGYLAIGVGVGASIYSFWDTVSTGKRAWRKPFDERKRQIDKYDKLIQGQNKMTFNNFESKASICY